MEELHRRIHLSTFFPYSNIILPCQAVISTVQIGQNNLLPKSCRSRTHSGYIAIFLSTTNAIHICIIKGWRISTRKFPSCRILPQTRCQKLAASCLRSISLNKLKHCSKTQPYWTLAVNAALKVQQLEAKRGACLKQI
jgi:hypothetical protein